MGHMKWNAPTRKGVTTPLSESYRKLLFSEDLSDVTLCVAGEAIYAHKLPLCLRSEKFRAIFYGPNSMRESQSKTVEIDCNNLAAFKSLLEYLYTNEVEFKDLTLPNVVELGYLSNEYLLPDLTALCNTNLATHLRVEYFSMVYTYAHAINDNVLAMSCIDYFLKYGTTTKEGLHLTGLPSELLVGIIHRQQEAMTKKNEFVRIAIPDGKSFSSHVFALQRCAWTLQISNGKVDLISAMYISFIHSKFLCTIIRNGNVESLGEVEVCTSEKSNAHFVVCNKLDTTGVTDIILEIK